MIDNDIIELQGFIVFYKYQNEQTGYKIALFKIDDNSQERIITIVGYFPTFKKDDNLYVKGKLTTHKLYGLQLEVEEIYKLLPTSKEMIIRYLSSKTFPKVGKKCAEKLYDKLKDDTILTLINNPSIYDELLEEKIISEEQKNSLQNGLKDYDLKSPTIQLLIRCGLSMKNIMKIETFYKDLLPKVLDSNPYQIIIDIDGIGFKTIDKLALNMNIALDDKRRIKAAIIYSVNNICHNYGNTYTFQNQAFGALKQIIDIDEEKFNDALEELINEKYIIFEENRLYHYKLYNAEINITNRLIPFFKRIMNEIPFNDFHEMIKKIEDEDLIVYSEEQVNALYEAVHSGFFILNGGPGTGKTTILKALIKIFEVIYGKDVTISLCAPTGRASKRMSILTDRYATTIHRLLKWDLHSNKFAINETNPMHTDIIIIDEFSMVDTLLFSALLSGIVDVSQIIIIGDDQQLPSVGAGNLLHDLLQIQEIKKYTLHQIFRQAKGSGIVELAHEIRNNSLSKNYKFSNDVVFFQVSPFKSSELICKTIKQAFENNLTFDDIQVIVPIYAGVTGIDNINKAIQDMFNPASPDKVEIRIGHQIIRINDRVLQLKNQPDDEIYNGDIGVVTDIDVESKEITVNFDGKEVIYPKQSHSNLTLAYAISVHKSQGSEFSCVIMCAFSNYRNMLNKSLIYTAITRAKDCLIIFGDHSTFIEKSHAKNDFSRNTTLQLRIRQKMENKF